MEFFRGPDKAMVAPRSVDVGGRRMEGWGEFGVAFGLFLFAHAIPARPKVKARIIAAIGRPTYLVLFNALSLALLAWLIVAAGHAPFVPLWDQQVWQRWLANVVMPLAIVLAVFGTGAVNPFSFGGRSRGFDPERPGIAGLTRHPLLWALLLWACVHMLANGDLGHGLLFGGFGLMAAFSMRAFDARRKRQWGTDEWHRLAHRTSLVPGAALLAGRWHPEVMPDVLRLAVALVLWLAILWLHPLLIGVSPLP